MDEGLSMFADDYSYVIARDAMDAARLHAEAFAGDADAATEAEARLYERVRRDAIVARAEEPGSPAVEKTARDWIASEGRGVFAWMEG